MKNILIALKNLEIGGIEKSAINLIKYLVEHGNNVTLVLEKKTGKILNEINSKVKIIEYSPCSIKFINLFKRCKFLIKYRNKFDVSISYATYSKMCSFVARSSSKNSILWCHANYTDLFNGNELKVKDFFYQLHYDKFKKVVFVAKSAKESFMHVFPNQHNVYFCNNLINYNDIYEKVNENIGLKYNSEIITFLNVGRHDEKQKKLSRILKAAYILKKDGYKFRVIFVGDGPDNSKYKRYVKKYNLEKNIIFTGAKENPYPYYKIANCVVLSSDYEGYPVVFLESYVMNKPIITTNVSDFEDIQGTRGIVVKKDYKEIYKAMKNFIDNGFEINNKFNTIEYNAKVMEKLEKILNMY